MSEFITINNATIVQGVSSTEYYLSTRINNRNVGIPVYSFNSTTPNIELLAPTPGLTFPDDTMFYTSATAYGIGMAVTINTSSFAVPLYKLEQDQYVFPNISFENPMLVSDLTATNDYMVTFLDDTNNSYFGMQLFNYGSLYQSTVLSSVALSAMPISTLIHTGKPLLDIIKNAGSTQYNPKIQAYSDLIIRVKKLLGWPSINIDLCDENIVDYIDQAMEMFTKYSGYTEEFLTFNTSIYKRGKGINLGEIMTTACNPELSNTLMHGTTGAYDYDLKDYRKVIDVWSFEQGASTGVNTLFTLEQAMAQQTYFSYMLGNAGFDLVTWDILKGWLETREKVLAQRAYFRFDPRTQLFRILPEPFENQMYYGVIGCYVERPIRDLISEIWVIKYTTALTKVAVGNIRGKFAGQVLFGGGTLNATDLLSQGLKEIDELEKMLFTGTGFVETDPVKFFLG